MSISRTKIRVRYAETDQMGVVYYANFLVWFEVGRVELMRQLGFAYKQVEIEEDCHIAVVAASCRYRSPARYDDELTIETTILTAHPTILKFGYRILRAEDALDASKEASKFRLLAEGETTHAVVNHLMRRTPLPEKYVAVLEKFKEQPSSDV